MTLPGRWRDVRYGDIISALSGIITGRLLYSLQYSVCNREVGSLLFPMFLLSQNMVIDEIFEFKSVLNRWLNVLIIIDDTQAFF